MAVRYDDRCMCGSIAVEHTDYLGVLYCPNGRGHDSFRSAVVTVSGAVTLSALEEGMPIVGLSAPEPAPIPTPGIPIWELVIKDMAERDHVGRAKYGTPLQADNGRDALVDAYQEALDLCVYLRQAIEERRRPTSGHVHGVDCHAFESGGIKGHSCEPSDDFK